MAIQGLETKETRRFAFMPYAVLTIALLALSSGSIMIKAADAPATVIATWRVAVASAIVAPYLLAARRRELLQLTRGEIGLTVLAGLLLAAHFLLWTASLKLTTVANSVMLANTSPIWIAIGGVAIGAARLTRVTILSVFCCMMGAVLVSWQGLRLGGETFQGDALALGAGVALAGYLVVGARALRNLSTPVYMGLTYTTAAVVLAIIAVTNGDGLVGFTPLTYGLLIALGVVSQLVGHGGPSWALKFLTPGFVSQFLLADLVISPFLALILFDEALPITTIIGCLVIGAGLFVASSEAAVKPTKRLDTIAS